VVKVGWVVVATAVVMSIGRHLLSDSRRV